MAAAHLVVVLLAVDGAAGLALILADVLALVARHYSVGLGHTFVLADIGFAALEAGGLGAGELARTHPHADAGLLVVLVGIDAGGSCLGRGGKVDSEQSEGREGGK